MGYRYQGLCDKDGCDFNSFRNGVKDFFGEGPNFAVDSSKPLTIVTQWITEDGTDEGDLSEIRRLYVQDGKVIKNSASPALGENFDSITGSYCTAQKKAYFDPEHPAPNDFARKGGLKNMGKSLDRGVVLVLSLWDDKLTSMNWLDSKAGRGKGSNRGPCSQTAGAPDIVRAKYPNAFAKYTNIMYGEIDSTYTAGPNAKPEAAATGNSAYAKSLKAYSAPPPSMQQQQPQQIQQQQQQPQPQSASVVALGGAVLPLARQVALARPKGIITASAF